MNKMSRLIISLFFFIQISSALVPHLVSTISQTKPSFISFVPSGGQPTTYSVVVSSFNGFPFSSDYVFFYPSFSLTSPAPPFVTLNNTNLHWPNEVTHVNESLLGGKVDPFGGLIVASGFLVPTKTNGGVLYYPFTNSLRNKVSANFFDLSQLANPGSGTWFYHRVQYVDLTGDGKKDLITCRANKPIFGSTKQQMVIYTLDGSGGVKENVILSAGCDVFFQVVDLDHDGLLEILSAVFFTPQLVLIWSDSPTNNYLQSGSVHTKTIDNTIGAVFDIRTYDFDQSGFDEVVVTNHQGKGAQVPGSLYLFSIPEKNFKTQPWTKKVLYDQFPVVLGGSNQAAPGAPVVFFPQVKNSSSSGLPWIAVAGDGASAAYVFAPYSASSKLSDVSYKMVWNTSFPDCTVGGIAIQDVDGDGYSEMFIPTYESNSFSIFTFSPNPPRSKITLN